MTKAPRLPKQTGREVELSQLGALADLGAVRRRSVGAKSPGTAGTVRGVDECEGFDMTETTPRLPILKVGQVLTNAAGGAHFEGWQFDTRLGDGDEIDMDLTGDSLAGWSVGDLHLISHGAPCESPGCPFA